MSHHKKFESSDESDHEVEKPKEKKSTVPKHIKFESSDDEEVAEPKKSKESKKRPDSEKDDRKEKSSDEAVPIKKSRSNVEDSGRRRDDDRRDDRSDSRKHERSGNSWKDDRRGGGESSWKRDDRRDYHRRGDDRRDQYDRDRSDRSNRRDRDHGGRDRDRKSKIWDRPSQEVVSEQRKLLWGKKSEPVEEKSAEKAEEPSTSALPKNATLWSSAIAATGVDGQQANKFLKLMGIKNTKAAVAESFNETKVESERNKQQKLLSDLIKQYTMARESTHMGRGMGLGFHGS